MRVHAALKLMLDFLNNFITKSNWVTEHTSVYTVGTEDYSVIETFEANFSGTFSFTLQLGSSILLYIHIFYSEMASIALIFFIL